MHRRSVSMAVLVTMVIGFMTALAAQSVAAAPLESQRTGMIVTGFDRDVARATAMR